MYKYDLTDVSFLIPIRLDSIIRLENLIASIKFLLKNFKTKVIVLQADKYDNGILKKLLNRNVEYHFIKDSDDIFYRTIYINEMVKMAKTPIVAIWDADVIVPTNQILESVEKIRNGIDVSYPYDGHFYDTFSIIRELYIKKKDIRILTKNINKMNLIYGNNMKGGAFIINRSKYIDSGMENEYFYGWGPEDFERYCRWQILGYKINFTKGNLYHLTHTRGINSTYRSLQQVQSTNKEYINTMCSCKDELIEHLKKVL